MVKFYLQITFRPLTSLSNILLVLRVLRIYGGVFPILPLNQFGETFCHIGNEFLPVLIDSGATPLMFNPTAIKQPASVLEYQKSSYCGSLQ